ncbi:hypothetical protein CUZ56_00483 [Saezia sanguinis]|uniref:Uncharacterized protein n=1 Tax=Saezia sanguinis TaxID=1965230 RepID=A0A433SH31_9BURK|nr:hypothetical protein [Saezia sanguinis]RUS67987.1 hypothetical protein CUZ56_00470 [Saezia sanguinis]RUS68000.1 hypothetical protein CUZ56_00483 [Saezia sanguinis]
MDSQSVYKLAIQAQLAAATRELTRLEIEGNPSIVALQFFSLRDGSIDVILFTEGGGKDYDGYEGYSL